MLRYDAVQANASRDKQLRASTVAGCQSVPHSLAVMPTTPPPRTPAPIPTARLSASHLPPDVEQDERDFMRLLERALSPSFTLVKRLGAGGMGSVYLARDPVLKRLVA